MCEVFERIRNNKLGEGITWVLGDCDSSEFLTIFRLFTNLTINQLQEEIIISCSPVQTTPNELHPN